MAPAASIRRIGFRKWYERELIKSHAALVTSFMCAVLVAFITASVPGPPNTTITSQRPASSRASCGMRA